MSALDRLARLEAEATPGGWFVVGPPWNTAAPFVNARSEDPHAGEVICDFTYMGGDDDWREVNNSEANAALIAEARNALPLLIQVARAARALTELPFGRLSQREFYAVREALAALEVDA